jgi:hypothetical protein
MAAYVFSKKYNVYPLFGKEMSCAQHPAVKGERRYLALSGLYL